MIISKFNRITVFFSCLENTADFFQKNYQIFNQNNHNLFSTVFFFLLILYNHLTFGTNIFVGDVAAI